MPIMVIIIPHSKNFTNLNMSIPTKIPLSALQVRYLVFHLVKAFGITDVDEYNAYIDSIPSCQGKSIDQLYDAALELVAYWEEIIKIQLAKEAIKNGWNPAESINHS